MQTTMIVAPIAAGLAILDFTGASRRAEEKVRESSQGILRTGFFGGWLVLAALHSVLRALSWPKRGIVGTLGLIVASAVLLLEMVHR